MQQIVIPSYGSPAVLTPREVPDPVPEPGEVRIRVDAAGVNFADLLARSGLYPDAPPLPMVVGYEVAGTIDAVGEGVDAERIGESVIALCIFGGYASAVCVPSIQAVRRPANCSPLQGASLPVQGLTAWMMCEVMGRVRAGDRVLVHSAGGGVGLMVLDLLKWRGAYAVGTASGKKHAFLEERGYDQLVDYRTQDFAEVLGGDEGFDLILDPIGGPSWRKDIGLLRGGGRVICFGFSDALDGRNKRNLFAALKTWLAVPWLKFSPIAMMNNNYGLMGVNMLHLAEERERVSGWLTELGELTSAGVVRPHIHAVVPFSEAAEAHRILHDRENLGKVLLVPDDRWTEVGAT